MGFQDSINYILFTNPISATIKDMTKKSLEAIVPEQKQNIIMINEKTPLNKLVQESGPFVRIAGIFGATAIVLGAYGAHKYPKEKDQDLQRIYETGNRYHVFNSLALLACPLCNYPKVSGSFLIAGIFMFSGACYYHAFTGENKFGKLAPIGGTCLILGWLAMVF